MATQVASVPILSLSGVSDSILRPSMPLIDAPNSCPGPKRATQVLSCQLPGVSSLALSVGGQPH